MPRRRLGPNDVERALAIKQMAQLQWGNDPAGSAPAVAGELGTAESFAEVERNRYEEQPWMPQTFQFERFVGCEVLEIGVGLGTDHVRFARAGARLTGIDLTPRCIELTRSRFQQLGFESDLRVMDAEHLRFGDDSFDAVYSFGVLHHVPAPDQAFREIRRVLRPGGVFIGAVYNRWSVFAAGMLYERLIHAEWRHESVQDRLSRIEYSTPGASAKPYVRLYTARELRRMLNSAGFEQVAIRKRHFGVKLRRHPPGWVDELMSRRAGWYLVHWAW